MSLLDGLTGALGQQAAAAVAAKMGIDPSLANIALGALVKNHAQPVDTVGAAAQETGLSPDVLGQVLNSVGGIGGLGALVGALQGGGQVADPTHPAAQAPAGGLGGILGGLGGLGGLASMIDQDGDGNPLDELAGIAGSFLKK